MPRIILTAQVEDAAHWQEHFRTHGDLFRSLGTRLIHYGVSKENEVALHEEIEDLEKFFELLGSPETAAAMAEDGVKRETVKVFVLDQEWHT